MGNNIYIVNNRGEKELFSQNKIRRSARRVGANPRLAAEIAQTIAKEAFPGMRTSDIFRKIKKILRQRKPAAAIRFDLKDAMRKLGPTGFPFEKYIGEIFQNNGFQVKLNQFISGICNANYEIDFLAKKGNLLYIGECKYHHLPAERVDLEIALANYARFLDIKQGNYFRNLNSQTQIKSILVTNTKFTSKAKKYSRCMGVELLGWRSPKDKGLEYFIDSQKLYPITILPSLKGYLLNIFASKKMLLAKDVLDRNNLSAFTSEKSIPRQKLQSLRREASLLLETQS